MSDKKFWGQYYQTHGEAISPSKFAEWVVEKYGELGDLIELGCGNGRDSIFFAKHGVNVIGLDQCQNMVGELNAKQLPSASFESGDFTRLDNGQQFDNVYSRFTLHSVDEEGASRTMRWAHKVLRSKGRFFIEVRGTDDDLFGQGKQVGRDAWFTDHYRRFVRLDELVDELKEIGFEIDVSLESRGFAPYKESDPRVIRVVARKI